MNRYHYTDNYKKPEYIDDYDLAVESYKAGNDAAMGYLLGVAMKRCNGSISPVTLQKMISQKYRNTDTYQFTDSATEAMDSIFGEGYMESIGNNHSPEWIDRYVNGNWTKE